MLMCDEKNCACLIDVSLCLETVISSIDLRESKAVATVIGYLEQSPVSLTTNFWTAKSLATTDMPVLDRSTYPNHPSLCGTSLNR